MENYFPYTMIRTQIRYYILLNPARSGSYTFLYSISLKILQEYLAGIIR